MRTYGWPNVQREQSCGMSLPPRNALVSTDLERQHTQTKVALTPRWCGPDLRSRRRRAITHALYCDTEKEQEPCHRLRPRDLELLAVAPIHAHSLDKVSPHGGILSSGESGHYPGEQLLLSVVAVARELCGVQSTSPAPWGATTSRHAGVKWLRVLPRQGHQTTAT